MPKCFRGRLTARKRCLLACAYLLDAPGGFAVEAGRRVVEAVRAAAWAATSGQNCVAVTSDAVAPLLPNGPRVTRWSPNLWSHLERTSQFGDEGWRLVQFLNACVYQPASTGSVNTIATECLRTVRSAADQETAPVLQALHNKHRRVATDAFKEEVFELIPEPMRATAQSGQWVGNYIPARVRDKVLAAVSRPRTAVASAMLADLVREVLGNPFRPPKVEPAWLMWNHGAARHIAERIAATGDFTDFPILADAIEDAGCRDEFLLAHCRQEKGHAPGCWALDAILDRN